MAGRLAAKRSPMSPIGTERRWRCPGDDQAGARQPGGLVVARWLHHGERPLEVSHPGQAGHHCIALSLKCTHLTFAHAGKTLARGRVAAGTLQITAPGVPCHALFESPGDVLHLFVENAVLGECYEDLFGRPHAGDIHLDDPKLARDPVLERLGQALAASQLNAAGAGRFFTDGVCLAIVSRVIARHFKAATRPAREASALPAWRLSRAIEYVDAHLDAPVRLADIASSAGLTRMHFASQFRRATGMSPHEYLLRRRIERAQHLLTESKQNLLDVALSCGFRSQAHFTTVFKRLVGEAPSRWRTKATADHPADSRAPEAGGRPQYPYG